MGNIDICSTDEIAEKLYDLCCDMDKSDYTDTKAKEISELENAIYEIKAIAENPYNNDCWRTFYKCLQSLANVD